MLLQHTVFITSKKKAKCTYDYDAENDDELSMKVGDIIIIHKMEDEGWWEGELKGMVPRPQYMASVRNCNAPRGVL